MENMKDEIAVVGVGCHFPGGEGLDSFWRVLLEGKNCTVEIPTERFESASWCSADGSKPGRTQTTRAALVDEFNMFDHRFFGITETEADLMDPQQKLLLHCTYRTLEDAGISMESISGSRTGVYIGDCQMALCGGVSCILEPGMFVALSKAKMISPGGTSKPFSSKADGYGRGEGCGVVLLKPLKDRLCAAETVDFQALSYTSACRRSHSRHKYRKSFSASSLSDLKRQLTSSLKTKTESTRSDVQLGFVFCGNGVAYKGMCKQLIRVPAFRDKIKQVESILQHHNSICISQWFTGEDENDDATTPSAVQPLLFAIQVGLVAALKHWGVTPDFVIGHSVGEVAAAHCSGLLSLEDAVKVLHLRSTFQNKVTGGKMLLVSNVSVEEVLETLPEFSGRVCVAAFNSPQSCTLSGDADAVDSLREKLRVVFSERSLFLHELDVPAAYHSHMMDPILDDIEKSIDLLRAENKQCELYSTVTGRSYSDGDFSTGRYWARNIREPVLFEQTLHAAANDAKARRDVVFVEISPRRALHRNIQETLGEGTVVLPAVLPGSSYGTVMSTLGKLFELGVSVDWHLVYCGFETLPTNLPIYQFVCAKKEVKYNTVRKADESSSSHGILSQIHCGNQEYKFTLSLNTASYFWEHKHNGIPIVPGALYVELAYAAVMANMRPKTPISLLQVSIKFESPFTLSSNCHQFRVKLEHPESEAAFKIQSSFALHASGTYRCTNGCTLEEPNICPDIVFQRCKEILKKKEIYLFLGQAGFDYGSVFKQLDDVYFGNEFKEAVTMVQFPGEIQRQLHEYFIHPVLLDYFLQMTAAVAMRTQTARPGFPSAIGSVRLLGPLQEKMVMYLRATKETPDALEVCGSFSTTEGLVLVELKGVKITFLGNKSKVQACFYHNELFVIPSEGNFQKGHIKAIVFEDKLGVAEGLRPYLHAESALVENKEYWTADELHRAVLCSCSTSADIENVLFLWGVEDLSRLSSEKMLDSMVTCCQLFCRIVLALKDSKRSFTVRVVTHRSSETTVDRVSAGFVLSGLTRACAAEMVDLSFQLIDLASVTCEDIKMLAHVIHTSNLQEVTINKGELLTTRIERTDVTAGGTCDGDLVNLSNFFLQTADPYRMVDLSSIRCGPNVDVIPEKSVEIRLTNMCAHTCDYFPVTVSHLKYGRTMYWKDYAPENYQLLSLDFSGVVSAVGKDVSGLKLGDHVASCYPVATAANIVVPEAACYSTKRLVFLRETPCVSYFVLAWEILQRVLSGVKHQHRKLAIVSSSSASSLVKVLALTANRSGWNVSVLAHFSAHPLHFYQSHAFVFLPPFDNSWQDECDSIGHKRHLVFVCSNRTSPTIRAQTFALKKLVHVHYLDLAQVFHRANLQEHNKSIFSWLLSLGLDRMSLKRDIIQLSSTCELQTRTNADSYFTMTTVQQIVLKQRNSDCRMSDIPLLSKSGPLFKQGCVYIVTGGLSGLGLETVKFIARNGGGCIATLSRSSLSNEMQFEMESLRRRYGVRILNVQCDVSVSMQVADAISNTEKAFPFCPIKGVFHSAAVLHDAFIENLDASLFRKVLKPKVNGTLNLHRATLYKELDFFVCYSSISSFIGNPSQANYAAANSFLDIFCHYRRNLGLAGQSINWGPLNVGLLFNKEHFQRFLEAKGMMVMDVSDIHEALEKSLTLNRPQQVICKFNFKNLNIHVLSQNASLRDRLAALVGSGLKDADTETCDTDTELASSSHPRENVRSIVSDISSISKDDLNEDVSLHALGIDSMLAMTLQNKIFQETGVNVPLVKILDPNVTLANLESLVINSA
ncbi:unnamed protein product [Tetraodon nigroviridis]|uniref:(spotted green pufferfish) hypothetical protein n=1 Tax=Tetraodon nigroviridis TaxID=99883 RepID=Q4S1K1_TETNG|nr:unnamed protein product [Tetraodon nigroviridis]